MNVTLTFVPPGGGESDYSLNFDLPGIPRPGDYIRVRRPKQTGSEDFIVRRTWWNLNFPDTEPVEDTPSTGKPRDIYVECEFALGHFSSEEHKKSCDLYLEKSGHLKRFEASAY